MTRLIRKLMLLIIIAAVLVIGLSAYVTQSVKSEIAGADTGGGISGTDAADCKSIDPQCILVLGCAVWANDEPSPMLRDRLDTAIALYKAGVAPKLLLSGDNSIVEYSEPDCMLKYTLAQGVPPEDIFLDYAGFSTYESVYRSHAVFMADRLIVVTQKYHLFRALKACEELGIRAKGVASNQQKYAGRYYREAREVLARDKDLFKGMIKAKPTFLGDEIPVDGDGTVTHLN
jgi:vancomycin permeability regulator SanA